MARTIKQSEFEKKDFVPQDLIEKLTASVDLHEQKSQQNTRKGFVPKAYLSQFENAIEQIRALRNDVDEEIRGSSDTSKDDEAKYKSQLTGFMTDLQKIMHDFRVLDGSISKVSQTAIRIGDRLENVEEQRQQIIGSEELIEHFLRFNKDKEYRDIDNMFFAESGEDLYRAARLIIKLRDIGTELTLPETQNARDEIQVIAAGIKEKLKHEFIRAYRGKREDTYVEMRQCATILHEFNDEEAKQVFLNLYLSDIDYHSYDMSSIGQFMNDLSRVIENAAISMMRVFPKPEPVIEEFIRKVFFDQILSYLKRATQPMLVGTELDAKYDAPFEFERSTGFRDRDALGHVHTQSNMGKLSRRDLNEYLSTMNIIYIASKQLLGDLKSKLLEIVFDEGGDEEKEKLYEIGHILSEEKLLRIVFETYQESYLKLEVKHLKSGLKELIKEHVVEPLKLENDYLSDDDDGNGDMAPDEAAAEMTPSFEISVTSMEAQTSIDAASEKKKRSNLLSALKSRSLGSHSNEKQKLSAQLLRTTRSYSKQKLHTTVKNMKNMLPVKMSHKEFEELLARLRNVFQFGINECVATMKKRVSISLARCRNISPANDLGSATHRVFLVYLDAVDSLFRKTLIPIAKETLPKKGWRDIKHSCFLEAVFHTNSALQLVEQCFVHDVAPNITESFEYSICEQDKNRVYQDFEHDILNGLKELLNAGLNIIDTIIGKEQHKSDFKPKADDITNLSATTACLSACQFIDQFRAQCKICLDGRNLDRFLLCLGTRLYYNIINHLKDYQYNPTGAMILVLDAKKYQASVKQFRIERINELFLTLVERTNLISIPAESIKPYIDADPKLNKIHINELKQWLKLRLDYKSAKIDSKLQIG
eukprot:3996_1